MASTSRESDHSDDHVSQDDSEDSLPSDGHTPTAGRPQLMRLPNKRSAGNVSSRDFAKQGQSKAPSRGQRTPTGKITVASDAKKPASTPPTQAAEDLVRLREAMNAKLAQQRKRGTPSPLQDEASQRPQPSKAPSAISAVTNLTSTSTESTESARTIRGSVPATPMSAARTPSYPFPRVPGVHQPFTTLSPTVSYRIDESGRTTRMPSVTTISEMSTPTALASQFLPSTAGGAYQEDPRFPTPNLYDLILQLTSEPGLDAWWTTVTRIAHEHFKAERATLAMPADPTDIENVPWGQKATFSMNGPEEFVSRRTLFEQTMQSTLPTHHETSEMDDVRPQKLHPERLRPAIESRHSYAGPTQELRDAFSDGTSKTQTRPRGPQRVATHAPGMPGGVGPGRPVPRHGESSSSIRHTSITDPDFSSIAGGVDAGPSNEVFVTLRALDHEVHPLIESGGVSRVLERGRLVAVTRDYGPDSSSGSSQQSADIPSSTSTKPKRTLSEAGQTLLNPVDQMKRDYDEYEQMPTSPWLQSPAPSPAIQLDEERNPFFASEQDNLEESFEPGNAPKDYSTFDQVEAIGVDRASTVLHIPLVHPTLSQPMQSLRMKSDAKDPQLRRSNTIDLDRKAPIAILSFLSSTIPYPPNLVASLKLLGPHLATSLALAQQFSYTNTQMNNVRRLRSISAALPADLGINIGSMALDDSINATFDDLPTSLTGSITSPSEYSGRSRHSPLSSPLGTPNWDPQQWARSSRGATGTPAASASAPQDYFAAKNVEESRTPAKTASTGSALTRQRTIQEEDESVDPLEKSVRIDPTPSKIEPNESASTGKAHRGMLRMLSAQTPDERRHSVLHSYGADFQASFGTPMVTTDESKRAQGPGLIRAASQAPDMPPPSERLLRTIIDSLPVQVFTAAPDTGSVTWVNSKFLIYRGQDSREVLGDPWQAIHPDDRKEYMETWQRCLKTGQQLQQKVRLQRFDGNYRWFYVRAAPLKDKRQHTVHWIGTNMDFHEQHIAEQNSAKQQETEASEAKYRALANSSPQIVFAVNRSSGVIFCNSQWMSYSGQTEAEALGAGFMDHVHPDDLSKCRLPQFDDDDSDQPTNVPTSVMPEPKRTTSASVQSSSGSSTEKASSSDDSVVSPASHMPQRKLSELAATGILKVSRDPDGRQSYSTEVRLKSKDGDYRWHLVRVLLAESALRTRDDNEETWYGTCTDINDHKTLEKDLKDTMDEKSRFLSNMSHEIRTPLNGITGMVNFLIDSNLTAEQMEHVNIIRASTEGLRGLINDILDLSKAEAGMIQLNVDWMYVRDLIEEVNDLTSTMAIDKGLELNYLVEQDVPPQIKGDRFRIRQILLNIVGNAIKFTQQGEVFVRCSVMEDEKLSKSRSEIAIRFDVVDTGRGFTDKEAEALFKRFSQIDGSSTRQHGGTGLGLVISRQLAQLHGGDMSARGSPGKGSTFTFYIMTSLPTRDDQPPAPPPTPAPNAVPLLQSTEDMASGIASARYMTGLPVLSPTRMTPEIARESPDISSASSDPSLQSVSASLKSARSSISSHVADSLPSATNMKLTLPPSTRTSSAGSVGSSALTPSLRLEKSSSGDTTSSMSSQELPIFSIMVVAPLKYSREATVQHIDKTLPKSVPHTITACASFAECRAYFEEPMRFSHVVAVLQDVEQLVEIMQRLLLSTSMNVTLVIITDLAQRRKIVERLPKLDYQELEASRQLIFVFKPLKPSRFGAIFDPRKERDLSADRAQDSAQQVALSQKQVFDQLTKRLGNRDKRVLLVEDNKVNQMVILKFFAKVAIKIETVNDGVQCTDKVFSHPPGHYSIILCDLHMPNKDGYQTCKEIRKWEKKKNVNHLPIIALSANVLGDVYQKCVDAGFNSYITKPVDFKELSSVLMTFMDPADPNKPHELMKMKGKQSGKARA